MATNAIDRFFDALANRDLDGVRTVLAPQVRVWHSYDGIAHDCEAILASFAEMLSRFAAIEFHDVRCETIESGYVRQHVMVLQPQDGQRIAWPVCLLARVHNGLITRIDEYIDRAGTFTPGNGPLLTPGF